MARRLADKPLSAATRARAEARRHRQRGLVPAAPPPEGNLRPMRHGAFVTSGESLPTYEEVVEQVRKVIANDCPWLRASDSFALENFCSEMTIYRHAALAFASMTPTALTKKHKAQRANIQRFRALNEAARDLGLTPAGRVKLGLTIAKTEALRVQPVRTAERASEVAQILAEARALPSLDPEPEPEPTPEPEPAPETAEVVVLRDVNTEVV